jgi:hypothetical protein
VQPIEKVPAFKLFIINVAGMTLGITVRVKVQLLPPIFRLKLAVPEFEGVPVIE